MQRRFSELTGPPAPLDDRPQSIPVPEVYESKWSVWDDATARLDGRDIVFVYGGDEDPVVASSGLTPWLRPTVPRIRE